METKSLQEYYMSNTYQDAYRAYGDTDKDSIAQIIRESGEWDADACGWLCHLADMDIEWDAAGDNFETIVYAAAEKLGVKIND